MGGGGWGLEPIKMLSYPHLMGAKIQNNGYFRYMPMMSEMAAKALAQKKKKNTLFS
jgi:hypothetical protein